MPYPADSTLALEIIPRRGGCKHESANSHFAARPLIRLFVFQLKSLTIGVEDTARECINAALKALDLGSGGMANGDATSSSTPSTTSSSSADGYQLWVRTKLDESPYPLIGHEIPLVIKLHWTRQAFNSRSQKSYDEYKAGCRCSFILR